MQPTNQALKDCLFCQIVAQKIPSFVVFEDENHLGFLNIFTTVEGYTILIPKKHYESDFAKTPSWVLSDLIQAAQKLSLKICQAYQEIERCALVFEGLEVNHLHAKLIPLSASTSLITALKPAPKLDDDYLKTVASIINRVKLD